MAKTMERCRRRLALSLLAALVMALGLCPATGFADELVDVEPGGEPVVVAQGEDEPALEEQVVTHTHDDVTFQPWESNNSLPEAGNYYLTDDVTLSNIAFVSQTIRLCLNGHKVTLANSGAWIDVSGTLELFNKEGGNGTIDGGYNLSAPCVVVFAEDGITGGVFNMHGGTITGSGSASSSYGGVYVSKGCTFNMSGGTITGRSAQNGGGVYVNSGGTFNMSGGTITGNSAQNGGGVYVSSGGGDNTKPGAFNMSGGTITGNSALNGGGVCVVGGYDDGTQEKNKDAATMTVSGDAVVSGNKNNDGAAFNVFVGQGMHNNGSHLPELDAKITVAGALADGASIGVTMQVPGTFTAGFKDNTGGADPATYFTSDDDECIVIKDADGEGKLAWGYSVKVAEGIQNGTVRVDKERAAAGDSVKIIATPADGYELDTVTVTEPGGRPVGTKDGSFIMPADDVTVSATFVKKAAPQPADVPPVSVTAHVQKKGTLPAVSGGAVAGTTGKSLRMESIRLTVPDASATGGIEYRGHVQRKGWEKSWARDGKLSGTEGKSRRLEAVQVRLWGDMAAKYDVYYRVHVQRYGWMAWAKNGASAGTEGMSRRVEAIQVVLVAKDGPAPAKAFQGATQTYAKAFVKK